MRKRHATQCYNKVAIWVSYERQFDWDHYNSQRKIVHCMLIMLNKKILFFDTHMVSTFVHRIDLRNTFVQKFILLGPKYSTKSIATQ